VNQYKTMRFKLARELADCYGIKGGIYRRQGKLEDAKAMYEAGFKYEQDYNIPDTYNRTNVIVLRLLLDPGDHKALGQTIEECRVIIQDQVKGKNKNKWWAWADLGLLNLLSVNLKETDRRAFYRKEAHNAYEQFKNSGAGMQHFESTVEVLKQLKQSFEKVDKATASLIQTEIGWLEENIPEH
jgi:tetratricopeptide (TPR) repeat protein